MSDGRGRVRVEAVEPGVLLGITAMCGGVRGEEMVQSIYGERRCRVQTTELPLFNACIAVCNAREDLAEPDGPQISVILPRPSPALVAPKRESS